MIIPILCNHLLDYLSDPQKLKLLGKFFYNCAIDLFYITLSILILGLIIKIKPYFIKSIGSSYGAYVFWLFYITIVFSFGGWILTHGKDIIFIVRK